MGLVDQEKYDSLLGKVQAMVSNELSQVGVPIPVLKTLCGKKVPDTQEFDDYHVSRFVCLVVTGLIRERLARLGCDSDGDILVFSC